MMMWDKAKSRKERATASNLIIVSIPFLRVVRSNGCIMLHGLITTSLHTIHHVQVISSGPQQQLKAKEHMVL